MSRLRATCANCHGENGMAVLPGAPNLSGQSKQYLRNQLRAYRSGNRRDPQMSVMAKSLTDAQIESLAEWYSRIEVIVGKPK